MIIRDAAYADSPDLARLQVDSYRSAYAGILPQEYLDRFTYEEQTLDWQELLAGPKEFILLVAEREIGGLAGYALGHRGETAVAGYDSELDGLHVSRQDQRQGAGRALMREIAGRLKDSGANSMVLWVLVQNPARALYERLGGKLLGRRSWRQPA